MDDKNTKNKSTYTEPRKIRDAQNDLIRAIDEFKAILKDSVHPENQNEAYKQVEQLALDKMIRGASELDSLLDEPGAGIFGLISLLFRSNLYLKNEIIKIRRELKLNEIKMMKMQSNIAMPRKTAKTK